MPQTPLESMTRCTQKRYDLWMSARTGHNAPNYLTQRGGGGQGTCVSNPQAQLKEITLIKTEISTRTYNETENKEYKRLKIWQTTRNVCVGGWVGGQVWVCAKVCIPYCNTGLGPAGARRAVP